MAVDYAPRIFSMSDTELEVFVNRWLDKKKSVYVSTEQFLAPGDMGRDVVGYRTPHKLDGEWDNYQCKQFRSEPLRVPGILRELGKVLYYSSRGHFELPDRFYFVAPRGIDRAAQNLLASPSKLRARLLSEWDKSCAKTILAKTTVLLDQPIQSKIALLRFENVNAYDASKLLLDPHIKPALVECLGDDPGPAPVADSNKPPDWTKDDVTFAHQLVSLYGGQDATVTDRFAADAHATHGPHLRDQFVRYFEADSFKRHYRDNTPTGYVERFEQDILSGVRHAYNMAPANSLQRVDEVTDKAGSLPMSDVLGKHAGIRAKQGVCHHLVNADDLTWKS